MDVISSLELFKLRSDNFKLIDVGLAKLSGTPPIMSNKSSLSRFINVLLTKCLAVGV